MTSAYHPGEQHVQARAGLRDQAERVGGVIRDTIPPAAAEFLAQRPLVFVAAAAERVWASALFGTLGFARALDERSVRIDAAPRTSDPIAAGIEPGAALGLLAIDPATRRRMRVNGTVRVRDGAGFEIETTQVYGNCPKYIQARELDPVDVSSPFPEPRSKHGSTLTPAQVGWLASADTFVIASVHPEGGADASHRGGLPGFVRVDAPDALVFPDYTGNSMFQTLGNLAIDPRAGLIFLDFASGATLQLSGRVAVDWDPAAVAAFPGAQRVVAFAVDKVVETTDATPLRWRFSGYSSFNPG